MIIPGENGNISGFITMLNVAASPILQLKEPIIFVKETSFVCLLKNMQTRVAGLA